MELPVQGMEALGLHMGVDLGGRRIIITQQKLHGPQVSPASRWVAKEWRKVCGEMERRMPASKAYFLTIFQTYWRLRPLPERLRKR